ncbi:PREDICTED: lipopolysaccharide-binding protein-like [Ceratotherium simum simum]|uniref:Bactericidal permeability-increasing protein n=1 Tax=Ceratotherium simum simum TaxID=73337 RepID=A0ABM1CU23_CERSS|nr:PREDICTED: lipopolysaccharide-binding protein-like [Ceratotherium simum simum]
MVLHDVSGGQRISAEPERRLGQAGAVEAQECVVATLQKELSTIEFTDIPGSFQVVSLNLGKDQSGRPTASVAHCDNSFGHISINISGPRSWILNFSRETMEIYFKDSLEQKKDALVPRTPGTITIISREPWESFAIKYLSILQSWIWVTWMIDQVAGIDYSLVGAPQVTSQCLDTPFKGEFFGRRWHSPVPFNAPPVRLPQEHDGMIYLAVSEYVFNTASRVYHQAGRMKFIIQNEYIPLDSAISLNTHSLWAVIPQLAKFYPNMELELEISSESAPFLMFTPGNVTLTPVMDIQAFALPPNSSDRKPLFQLRAGTSVSATISVTSSRIIASLTLRSKLKLELKHSNIGFINVDLMETILNFYAFHVTYPSLSAKLEEGFPLPLSQDTSLTSVELQIHKNFLLLGANIDKAED